VAISDATAPRPRRTSEHVIAPQSRNYIRKGDRLIWTDPRSGTEIKVTAAAGESDGLVVVKQNGTLLPCPVDQVRRIKRAAAAGRK